MKLLAALSAAALLTGYVSWDNGRLVTEEFVFPAADLPEGFDGLRIVHLTDLHGRQFGDGNRNLARAVERAAPDLIFLTGDMVDEQSSLADLLPLIRALTPLAPVYYVTGNHEWGSGQAQAVVDALRDAGVTCLENEYVPCERGGQRILIAGIHDPNGHADQKMPEALAQEIRAAEPGAFWLLLAHRNSLFSGRCCRLGAALTFCGHAHGGIWRLPFTDGLVSTDKTLFPSFTSGFYPCDDGCDPPAWVFVSRGLGISPPWAFRLLNPPQVAVVTLKKYTRRYQPYFSAAALAAREPAAKM